MEHEALAADGTVRDLRSKLDSLIGDAAYIGEMRQRSEAQSRQFIFDGFFNKLLERFSGEYAVQFAEAAVDPDLDQTGLKVFLEELMSTPEQAEATIESVFAQIGWDALEQVLSERCDLEMFTSAKLVIKRSTYEEICAFSEQNFRQTAAKFRQTLVTGKAEGEIHLVLCFDEATNKIRVDLNGLLPWFYVFLAQSSTYFMRQGAPQDFKVCNKPILLTDTLDFCEHLLEAKDIVPPGCDVAAFFSDLLSSEDQ